MSANAAYLETVGESASTSGFITIGGVKNATFGPKRDMLDISTLGGGAAKAKLAGMTDGQVSIDGDFIAGDTGQAAMRAAWASGADLYIQLLFDGTNGYYVKTKISQFDIKGATASTVSFSATCEFNSGITAVGSP